MTAVASTFASAAQQVESLKNALCHAKADSSMDLSPFAACLVPLLEALDWRGDPRQVAEALPHFAETLDLTDLRNVLANLGYRTRPLRGGLHQLDARLLPCLYVTKSNNALVALERRDGVVTAFDGAKQVSRDIGVGFEAGMAYVVEPIEQDPLVDDKARANWFGEMAQRFRGLVIQMLGISFVTNLLALAMPLFIMAVYDHVIGSKSAVTLTYLLAGVAVAVLGEFALRLLRARSLAHVGARLDYILGTSAFRQILHLPPAFTERAPVGAQIARLREFESLRDFFTSPLATVVLELPFVVIFLGVIALLGGPLALIPLLMMGIFAFIGFLIMPRLRRQVRASSTARSTRHGFLVEALSRMRTVKQMGAEDIWMERYRKLSADASMSDFRARMGSSLLQTLAHLVMVAAGIATLAWGAMMVMSGDMTSGALVASLILVWRVLAPLQLLFNTVTRFEQVRLGVHQINQLMQFKPEREPGVSPVERKVLEGNVTLSRVSLRYTQKTEPALIGVGFEVKAGEVVAVVGPNGSGKSSVLKLIAGMYAPQAGTVAIDGIDIRQMDPIELRQSIAYVPQYCHEFYGTIAQNLRLAQPTASDDELRWACRMAAVLDEISRLPEGFETRLRDHAVNHLPSGLHQRLALARAYLRRPPIMLLDEPANTLDEQGDMAFMDAVRYFKGKTTLFIVTHRPSHMKLADKIVFLNEGRLEMAGPTGEILPRIPGGLL